jgi:hypothetical protein
MRKASYIPALVISLIGVIAAVPAQPQVGCGEFQKAIDHSNKLIALTDAEGIGDNSAARAQLQEAQIANYLRRIELNLTLMIQNKCAVPKEPFTTSDYLENALKCSTEQINGNYKSPECDLDKWSKHPEAKPVAAPQ